MIGIIIPVLGRAHQIEPLLINLKKATDAPYRVLFVCSSGDDEARLECERSEADTLTVRWEPGYADFAKKVNLAYTHLEEEWLFQGATDLVFHPGWASRVLKVSDGFNVGVIGTNDLGNPMVKRGNHSTHTLFSRTYIEENDGGTWDNTGRVFSEAYSHEFVDTEFIQTAIMRGQFRSCRGAVVEHMHPHWGKGEMDATYEKATRKFREDAVIYNNRMRACKRHFQQRPLPA